MSLPTSDSIPEDNEAISPARRRRDRRLPVPAAGASQDERLAYLDELAERAIPSIDYYLFAFLAGLVMGAGILLGSPAMLVLGAVLAPLTGPFLGLGLATIAGSGRFFWQSLGALLVGGIFAFGGGCVAGLASLLITRAQPAAGVLQATAGILSINLPTVAALTIAVIVTTVAFVRSSGKAVLTGSVITYLVFLPLTFGGLGLATGEITRFLPIVVTVAAALAWTILIMALTLGIMGFRPYTVFGFILGGLIILLSLAVLAVIGLWSAAYRPAVEPPAILPAANTSSTSTPTATLSLSPTPSHSPTPRISATPTNTLIPSLTPSQTVTPAPTPVWAIINAASFNGAYIRSEPKFGSKILISLLNGTLVQVLPDTSTDGGTLWVKIRTNDGLEGWIVQGLLVTATPVPGW